MAFYILSEVCDTPETGHVFPQIQKLKTGYDVQKPDSIYSHLKKSRNGFPDEVPDLDSFILHGRAKPTDLVSNAIASGSGLFVSEKLKSILSNHNLADHRFYPAKVAYKNKSIENYYWAQLMGNFTDTVDFTRSTFFIYKHYREDVGDIDIDSISDYNRKKAVLIGDNPGINITIWAKRLCLYPSFFSRNFDLFKIGFFDTHYYISQSLRDELIKSNITGCDIRATDRIIS